MDARGWLARALAAVLLAGSAVGAQERQRARSRSLNETWQFAVGEGHGHAETLAGQAALTWKPVTLPRPFVRWSQHFASDGCSRRWMTEVTHLHFVVAMMAAMCSH